MKKEKQVRSYKRRTKSGKIITVKAHTAKYEAADEKAKKSSKKEGAGKELEERKKKSAQLEPFGKEKKVYEREENEPDFSFTADYYRYNSPSNTDTKSKRYKTDMARAISIDASALAEQEVNKKYGAKADHNSPAARKIYEKYYKKGHQILNELTGSKPEKPTEKTDRKKKVRPVGGGTVGPEPKKKKSPTGSTNDDQAVINFMESTYHVHYNPKTGKFDYALTGRQTKTRSVTMENARKSLREHQAYLSKLKSRDNLTPADKDSLSKARKGGYMPTKGKSLESGVSTTKKTTKTTPKSTTSEPAFTAAEFKEWYRGTGSAADKKVAKALRAQLGRSGYRKFEDEAIDNYSSRGHLSMFKRVTGTHVTPAEKKTTKKSETNEPIPKKKSKAKMPESVLQKKKKYLEFMKKVKASGMTVDEYTRSH